MLLTLFFSLHANAFPPPPFNPRPPMNDCRTIPCPAGSECMGAMGRFFCVQMADCSRDGCAEGEACVQTPQGPRCEVLVTPKP